MRAWKIVLRSGKLKFNNSGVYMYIELGSLLLAKECNCT